MLPLRVQGRGMGRMEGKRGAGLTALRGPGAPLTCPATVAEKLPPKRKPALSTDLMQDYSHIPNMCLKKLLLHLRESRFHYSGVSYGLGAFDL